MNLNIVETEYACHTEIPVNSDDELEYVICMFCQKKNFLEISMFAIFKL